jgi:hypothetical protein
MPRKRKTKPRTTDYKPVFTAGEYQLMQNYGPGDLMDEIGLNRIMLLRTTDKMNQVQEQLTYHDYLDTVRVFAYATGRIASMLERREKLYQPYQELEKYCLEYMDQINKIYEDLGVAILGQEKWDEIYWDATLQAMDTAESQKKPKPGRRRAGNHNEE